MGLLCLVVPGIYLAVRYALFGFCMIGGETDLVRSFQQSAILSAGKQTYLLAIGVSFLVLNVLGAGFLGVGLFLTVPLSILTMLAVYRQLHAD
jgi:hypothetical protein